MSEGIESEPYSIGRTELTYALSRAYLNTYWPVLVTFPIGALLLYIFMKNQVGVTGTLLLLSWPITIPARVGILSFKMWKNVRKRTQACLLNDEFLLSYPDADPDSPGLKITLNWIWRAVIIDSVLLLEARNHQLYPICFRAFQPADQEELRHWLIAHRLLRSWTKIETEP